MLELNPQIRNFHSKIIQPIWLSEEQEFLNSITRNIKTNKEIICPNVKNFLKSGKFDLDLYKKFSAEEKTLLQKHIPGDTYIAVYKSIPIAGRIKNIFDQKYGPNKYTFVSIGRSPAMIGKILEHLGVDVKYMPISGCPSIEAFKHNKKQTSLYIDFLQNNGFSAENIKESGKKAIFCDYTVNGKTIKTIIKFVKDFLNLPQELTGFKSLNQVLRGNREIKKNLSLKNKIEDFIIFYWRASNSEIFSHIPMVHYNDIGSIKKITKNFKPSLTSQLFDFSVVSTLERSGRLVDKPDKPLQSNASSYTRSALNKIKSLIRAAK